MIDYTSHAWAGWLLLFLLLSTSSISTLISLASSTIASFFLRLKESWIKVFNSVWRINKPTGTISVGVENDHWRNDTDYINWKYLVQLCFLSVVCWWSECWYLLSRLLKSPNPLPWFVFLLCWVWCCVEVQQRIYYHPKSQSNTTSDTDCLETASWLLV